MVTIVDEAVEEIVQTLQTSGVWNNTVLIITTGKMSWSRKHNWESLYSINPGRFYLLHFAQNRS